ncbi:TldD/PmbA family protein [Bacteriovorax stolpii]|uniref:TldD/PmbA family protein n=1 Tax=Bacteriovorax stolpii TaxID=960 RepID=A0A2K9NWB0_BACTC|nr:TldD/PmbA family protein [Bacteriovorax stolpii]AUN99044.1 TldD/PmbA family protein [Bacteriovorax stolpii]QDK40962.1 TldD/PmbA family protein [Bacteriovorax stolpii]TDP55430.1 TldD protein [Bacteriovorax stolpii]
MDIKSVLDKLDLGKFPCHFVDVRIERTQSSSFLFQNGELVAASERPVLGAFVRVHHHGAWFYSSTTAVSALGDEITKLIKQAEAGPHASNVYVLPDNNGAHHLINKTKHAFSNISLEEKVKMGERYLPLIKKIENLKDSRIRYTDVYKEKFYKSSVGTEFSYDFNQAGFAFGATLKKGDELFEDGFRLYATEFNSFQNLENDILSYFAEAQKFLSAKTITPGKYKVVLSPEITGVFTHESFGHKSEADFMMGDPEATKEWKLGSTIAAPCLSIVDTGVHDNTSGYCPIDDEGTLAQKTYLIKEGVLTGRLHSTHTANVLEEKPTGNARAMNFEYEPIVRMTSTYIEGGKVSFKDLLKKAEGGVYFYNFKHGSGGSTFTIAPIRAYMIRNGELAEPVRVSVLSGSVFETLKQIEACGDDFHLESSAFGGCGKMEQWPLPVADGGPSILVNEMQIS